MKKLLLLAFIAFSSFAYSQVPNQINYQAVARNSVGNVLPNRKITARLSIRDGSATGTVLYKETRTITTNNFGLFTIAIGSAGADNTTGTISGIDWSTASKFIQVEVDPDGGSNFINMGAAQLLSVPYALYAGSSNTGTPTGAAGGVLIGNYPNPSIANGAITSSMIASGVLPTSLPPNGTAGGDLSGSYPNPTIKNGAINSGKLADNAVTTSKVLDGSITLAKLGPDVIFGSGGNPIGPAGGDLTGSYPNPTVNNAAITTTKLADNSVTTSKIVNASVTSAKLAAGVIPTSLPPNGTAGGDLTGSYPNPTINNGVITTTKLADNSITTLKIVDASVTSAKLAAGVIPTSLPPNGAAGGDLTGSYPNPLVNKIQNITVSNTAPINGQVLKFNGTQWVPATDDVASGGGSNPTGPAGGDLSGSYPNPNIASSSVTTPKIENGAVITPKLADLSVTTAKIVDGAVTSAKLAAGVIPTSLPPTGTAGGDLTGSYPNPSVNKILGVTVTTTGATNGQVLKFNGTSWIPGTDNTGSGGSPTGPAGGDLTGSYPNPTINTGAITTTKIADGSVTSTKLAAGVIPTSLPPNGSAGGDLTGSYPNPTLNKIQGVNVTAIGASTGQVLKFDGTSWVPGTDNTGSGGSNPTGPAGGDLTGSYPNPTINNGVINTTKLADNSVTTLKIVDASVTSAKLAAGVIPTSLPPNGTAGGDLTGSYPNPTINNGVITTTKIADNSVTSAKLAAGVIPTSLPPNGAAGGDLTGSYPNPTINNGVITTAKLADNSVTTAKIVDASVTSSKLAAGLIPTSLPPSGGAGGDLSGSYPSPTVNKIQGIAVSNTGLASGMVLKYDGTQWAPATDNTGSGSFSLPYSSSASSSSNLFSLTNTGTGAALEGINSNTAANVNAILGRITSTTPGATSAAVKGVNSGTGTNGIGVYGNHLGNGWGVFGNSVGGTGVYGNSLSGFGLYGKALSGTGVYGESVAGNAGFFSTSDVNNSLDAVYVSNLGQGNGIYAESTNGNGITAVTNSGSSAAIWGFNNNGGVGIYGVTFLGTGAAIKGANTTNGGTAIEGELLNSPTSGNLAVFKVDGTNMARINHNGRGYFNGGTQNSGADVAEAFEVEGNHNSYEPGDVLIISQSSDRKVEKSNTAYSTLVAGVYATKPGVLLTEENIDADLASQVPMGVIGVIPTKVCLQGGAIKRGDMLVTSSIAGVAMKADPDKVKVGQVLGKALEDYSAIGIGKIKVLISVK